MQGTKHLGFFTSHHVRHAVFVNAQTGHDGNSAGLHPCKLRRNVIEERYGNLIDALYGTATDIVIDARIVYESGETGNLQQQALCLKSTLSGSLVEPFFV